MASRLAGVTRSRSIRPLCSSKMVPKPIELPLTKASSARMPGRKSASTSPFVGWPGEMPFSSGVKSAR